MEESKRFELIIQLASINSMLAGCSENTSDAIAALADTEISNSSVHELNKLGFVRGCISELLNLSKKLANEIDALEESIKENDETLSEYERS